MHTYHWHTYIAMNAVIPSISRQRYLAPLIQQDEVQHSNTIILELHLKILWVIYYFISTVLDLLHMSMLSITLWSIMIYTHNRSVNTDAGGRSKVATGTIHGFRESWMLLREGLKKSMEISIRGGGQTRSAFFFFSSIHPEKHYIFFLGGLTSG